MKTKDLPSPSEWDFSSCPDNELYDCFIWETRRHAQWVLQLVRESRVRLKKQTYKKLFAALSSKAKKHGPLIFQSFFFAPEFPAKPFLSIDAEERAKRRKIYFGSTGLASKGHILEVGGFAQPFAEDMAKKREETGRASIREGHLETVVFHINWTMNDDWLIEVFTDWLDKHRPKDVETLEFRGNASPIVKQRKMLKALTAWRLMEKYSVPFAQAAKAVADATGGRDLYGDQTSWLRGCRETQQVIDCLNKSGWA